MIDSYNKLTLAKYQELYSIEWSEMNEIDIQANMIAILNDMSVDEVMDLPINEYKKMVQSTVFLTKEPVINKRIPNKLKLNDAEYEIIKQVKDMTAGQYIDYQQYLSFNDLDKYLPHILSCFIIPKGKKYGDYDIELTIKEIAEYLTVEEALNIAGFFMKQFRSLTKATLFSLEWKMKRMAKKEKNETMKEKMMEAVKALRTLRNIIKNGDGFQQLIQ